MKIKLNDIKKLRSELIGKQKPIHSLAEVKRWYFKIVKKSNVKVKKINLSQCRDWSLSKKDITHKSKKIFQN